MSDLDLDQAMKRYAEGDRSPEVLAAINHAGQEAFQFPPLPEGAAADWKADPTRVSPLSFDRLRHWALTTRNYRAYQQEGQDRLMIRFTYSVKSDRAVHLTVSITGKNRNILRATFESDKRVPPEHFVKALRCANTWNQDMRWPKAVVTQEYLHDKSPGIDLTADEKARLEDTRSSALILDSETYLKEGIHQAGLEALLNQLCETSWDFWEQLHEVWGL